MLALSPMLSRFAEGGGSPGLPNAAMEATAARPTIEAQKGFSGRLRLSHGLAVSLVVLLLIMVSFSQQLFSLELWLLGLRLPRAVVASIFPLCGWVWGAQGLGVALLSYTLYTAMLHSSGDYAPARWNELMVDQQLNDDEATAADECPPCPPAGALHQRSSKS